MVLYTSSRKIKAVSVLKYAKVLSLAVIFMLLFTSIALAEETPFMPSSPQEVLKDMEAAPDVIDIISGGWGYTQDTAMVIGNPYKGTDRYFNIPPLEHELLDIRNREEFFIIPSDGDRFIPLEYEIQMQSLLSSEDGRHYDKLNATVKILAEDLWPELKILIDEKKSNAEILQHFKDKILTVDRVYWFDITEPFNDNASALSNTSSQDQQ